MSRTNVSTHTRVSLLAGTGTPRGPMIVVATGRKATAVVAVVVAVPDAQALAIDTGVPGPHDRVVAPRITAAPIRSTILNMTIPRVVV